MYDQNRALQLHALAYNLSNFLRTLVLPDEMESWSLTTIRETVLKIGAKVISHARYAVFHMAEVAVSRWKQPLRHAFFRLGWVLVILPPAGGGWAFHMGNVGCHRPASFGWSAIQEDGKLCVLRLNLMRRVARG